MKKFIIAMILILFLMTTSAQADDWAAKDTAYQAAFLLFHGIDYLQVKEIIRDPKFYERNLILGRDPTHNQVDAYFLGTALAHTGIAYLLPENYYVWGYNIHPRRVWQCVFIGIEVGCTVGNYNAGIRIRF